MLEALAECQDPDRREQLMNELRELEVPEEDINAAIEDGDKTMAEERQREQENAISSSSQPSVHQSQYLPHESMTAGQLNNVANTSQGATGFPHFPQNQSVTQSSQQQSSFNPSAPQAAVGNSQVTGQPQQSNTQVPCQSPQLQNQSSEVQNQSSQSQQLRPPDPRFQAPSPQSPNVPQNIPGQQQHHHVLPHSAPGPYSSTRMRQPGQASVATANTQQQPSTVTAARFVRPKQGQQRGAPRLQSKIASQSPMLMQQLGPGQGRPARQQNPKSLNMLPNQVISRHDYTLPMR